MYNSDTKTITIRTVPSDVVAFRVVDKDGNPVYGANVTLCNKGIIPNSFDRVTDLAGIVMFSVYDIVPPILQHPDAFKKVPWLFMANIPDSEYAYWKDNVNFNLGELNLIKLKKYTEVPTFWIKIELRDIIGVELFSNLVAEVEKVALDWAGMEVVEVKGKGTRTVTVYFKPPWYEGSIVVTWIAAKIFILKVLVVAGAIIAILLIIEWKFGEVVKKVAEYFPWILVLIGLSIAAKPAVEYVRERRREPG